MKNELSPIIKAKELTEVCKSEDLILVDASNGKNAKANYNKKHLEGALFVDLNTQLANIKEDFADGGRHPLPTIEQFSEVLTGLGVTPKSYVVIYDDKNGANAAARFWWMLKSAGHKMVQVLDGGMEEAENIGFPISSEIVEPKLAEPYVIKMWKLPMADIFEVEKAAEDDSSLVVDVRDSERYNGEKEPIDLIAGHIPGAINVPFTTNLDSSGQFLSPDELRERYTHLYNQVKSENIIVHCGSGVTACHTLLALAYAGMEIPKLYVGSWSEWSRNNKLIATKISK